MSTTVRPDEDVSTAAAGWIEYLVIEFPSGHRTGENLPLLVDLVDRGIIRLLDLVFIRRQPDGTLDVIALVDLDGDGDGDGELDLAVFHGASSGLLGTDDLNEAGAVLEPGSSAAVVLFENLWAAPLAAALHRGGARLVAGGLVSTDALIASLDAAETADAVSTGT